MEHMSVDQAAERLGVDADTVVGWIHDGTLEGREVRGRWQVSTESVERAWQVRETQQELVEEGYLSEAEVEETTRQMREEAEHSER